MAKECMTIQEYCKKNRCWAAKDDEWDEFEERPDYIVASNLGRRIWFSNGMCSQLDQENLVFPDVPAEKSLVAPDGRFILMEPQKEKINASQQLITQHDGICVFPPELIEVFRKPKVSKHYKPKKYDIVFVWDDGFDDRLSPVTATYWGTFEPFASSNIHAVFPFGDYVKLVGKSKKKEQELMKKEGNWYNHVLPFDILLVGLPIKDLSKEA